mmetsp:Transcript_15476/g.38648  ORF Transcript_15476/g.38648 Transcript_15476/m.38648 type:complete len:210 (+) Transcript_15476:1258-1887(+)
MQAAEAWLLVLSSGWATAGLHARSAGVLSGVGEGERPDTHTSRKVSLAPPLARPLRGLASRLSVFSCTMYPVSMGSALRQLFCRRSTSRCGSCVTSTGSAVRWLSASSSRRSALSPKTSAGSAASRFRDMMSVRKAALARTSAGTSLSPRPSSRMRCSPSGSALGRAPWLLRARLRPLPLRRSSRAGVAGTSPNSTPGNIAAKQRAALR